MAVRKAVHPKIIRPFRVIVFQEEAWLSARVLEYNLAAQARTLDGLYVELERVVLGHIAARRAHGQEPFAEMPRAPKKYWEMFRRSKVPLPTQKFPIDIKKPTPLRIARPEVRVVATR